MELQEHAALLRETESYIGEDTANHGSDGPIHITSVTASDADREYALREPMQAAYKNAGVTSVTDGNSGEPICVLEWVEHWHDGKRQISETAYNLSKTSLTVLATSPVQKVRIDPSSKRATGNGHRAYNRPNNPRQ